MKTLNEKIDKNKIRNYTKQDLSNVAIKLNGVVVDAISGKLSTIFNSNAQVPTRPGTSMAVAGRGQSFAPINESSALSSQFNPYIPQQMISHDPLNRVTTSDKQLMQDDGVDSKQKYASLMEDAKRLMLELKRTSTTITRFFNTNGCQ